MREKELKGKGDPGQGEEKGEEAGETTAA